MVTCSIKGCTSNNRRKDFKESIKFFKFPNDIKVRKLWIKTCDQKIANTKIAKVCSLHFTEEDYSLRDKLLNIPINRRILNPSAIPTQCLLKPIKPSAREKRAREKARKETVTTLLENFDKEQEQLNKQVKEEIDIDVDKSEERKNARKETVAAILENFDKEQVQFNTTVKEEIDKDEDKPKQDVYEPNQDVYTQTETDYECPKIQKIMEIKAQIEKMETEIIGLKRKTELHDEFEKSLSTIFTSGQISKLKNPEKKIEWSLHDITSAKRLHSTSPKTYRYLVKKHFPLPVTSTLRRWSKTIDVQPGILSHVLNLMEKCDLDEKQRLCALCFDEMKPRSEYEYDETNDPLLCPSNNVKVVMVRGILQEWKQPIFYAYDCKMTNSVISSIISKLYRAGYKVVAIVSDMASSNQIIWRDFEIDITKTWIQHPENPNEKIFVFADTPHLLMLLRKHFIETGFTINEKFINIKPIRELLNLMNTSDFEIDHEITEAHLKLEENTKKQEIKLATQLFSHAVSSFLQRCLELGKCKSGNILECANFIKLVNNWFDTLNSGQIEIGSRKVFGIALEEQNGILNEMDDTILNLRIPQESNLLPFQEAILITNASLRGLFIYLQDNYGLQYLLTTRINLDILESFFSTMRSLGGQNDDHPSGKDFKYRLRSYLLGNLFVSV